MRLRMRRFRLSLGVSSSFLFMTICRWERSPMTTALSASLPAMRCEALCRQSRCLLRLRSETRWYTQERRIYRRDFFLHLTFELCICNIIVALRLNREEEQTTCDI